MKIEKKSRRRKVGEVGGWMIVLGEIWKLDELVYGGVQRAATV